MNKNFDAIIIGAGSVGQPTAYYLSQRKLKVLIIEELSQVGQGQNKAAIGGIRATHSDPTKIELCKQSLDIYRNFTDTHKINIEYKEGGYCFPAFREEDETTLKSILPIQKEHNLNIDWVDANTIKEIIPGINKNNLRGGTYSPNDADISTLRIAHAWYQLNKNNGCEYVFNESVIGMEVTNDRVTGIKTDKNTYNSNIIVNAAGAKAKEIGKLVGMNLPVEPDSHESGISAPIKQFLGPLVVDIRPGPEGKTANFYFAQNKLGQIIFCYTPKTLFKGTNRNNTSEFMPIIAKRLIDLMPAFKELLIRRTWRGLYPMTPDGSPIIGDVEAIEGMYLAIGMCGQGLMLGPAVGMNLANIIVENKTLIDENLLNKWSLKRDFSKKEALK